MLKFILSFTLALFSVSTFALSNSDEYKAMFRFNHGSGFQLLELGTRVVKDQARDLKLTYNFAVSGGAIGTINLPIPSTSGSVAQPNGVLPKNAIVTGCYIDVITAPTSGGSATIAFSTGQTAADLKAATSYSSFSGIVACIPTGTAASSIKLTADSIPTMTIATAALTAGKINLHIQYVLSD